MKVGFLSNKLTLRGTEMTLYTYADYNERILKNSSIIITRSYDRVMQVSPRDVTQEAYTRFTDRFQVEYYTNPSDVDDIVRRHGIDVLFIEKAGSPTDGLVFSSCKTLIHAVFTTNEPHGDLYLPISDALNTICGTNYPVLPYCITVDDTQETLHEELGIPRNATVFGSYSGADEYNVEYVREAIRKIGTDSRYAHIYFIFLNVIPFCNQSERIRFLPGTGNMKYKRKFINTCDAMLYARNGGETFGLACGEFSVCNKPVIARPGEHSNAHEMILGKDMIRHTSYEHVYDILTHWDNYVKDVSNNGYKTFVPEMCMEMFQKYLWQLVPSRAPVSPEIIFVTAFKNIKRDMWRVIPRSVDKYIEDFLRLAKNIRYRLIVFVEPPVRLALEGHNLPSNIELRDAGDVHTFYDMYIEQERAMIMSPEYKAKIPADRVDAPEHWCAEYTMVNHSKINYIKYVKDTYPGYTYYSWVDFGCIRNRLDDVPNIMDMSRLSNKVTYLALKTPPSVPIDANDMLRSHDVYLAGSQFIIHVDMIDMFEELYHRKLREWKERVICDEDQGLVLQLYFDNPSMFQLFHSNEWFSLFHNHLNIQRPLSTRDDLFEVIQRRMLRGSYIEIGVARGIFTRKVLENTHLEHLYLIDPYIQFKQNEYMDGMNMYNMDYEYNECRKYLSAYRSRISFVRKLSSDAVTDFSDNSIDVVYIDGNHEYKYVIAELEQYWPKVRRGGILCGDDVYQHDPINKNVLICWDNKPVGQSTSFGLYGVHAAVVDFATAHNLHYTIFNNQFIFYKV